MWDLLNFIGVIICTLLVMWAFNSTAFIGTWPRIGATALLFLLYATSAVPFSYLLSFSFKTHASAQVRCGEVQRGAGRCAVLVGCWFVPHLRD